MVILNNLLVKSSEKHSPRIIVRLTASRRAPHSESMFDDTSDSRFPAAGIGSVAVLGGIVCCMGLKLLGGAILFSGIATVVGLSTGLVTFLVGGVGGLIVALLVLGYRRAGDEISPL